MKMTIFDRSAEYVQKLEKQLEQQKSTVLKRNKPVVFFEDVYDAVEADKETKNWGAIKKSDCANFIIDRMMDDFRKSVDGYIGEFIQEQEECEKEKMLDQFSIVDDDWVG